MLLHAPRTTPISFGSWHTSLPKTSTSVRPTGAPVPLCLPGLPSSSLIAAQAPESTNNLSALAPLLRATNQTLYGVDALSCADLEQLPELLERTADAGVRIFAVLGSHSPLVEYCPVFHNAAGTDLNWTAVGHELATRAAGYPHFLGVYVDDFYAAINHTGHASFGRGGVRVPAYSLAESADALRSALKAVRPDLFFIPLVYTQQFGYGLPGAHVIGAPGGAPFAGTASAAVSFATEAAGDGQAEALDGATLRLFYVNDLDAWYLNATTVLGAISLSVSVNGHELMRVDAASEANARRFKMALPAGLLKPGGGDTITVTSHPTGALAGTGHMQSLDRLSYVWGVSLKTAAGKELVRSGSASYSTSSPTLVAQPTDDSAVIGHCDAIIAMTSEDPTTFESAEVYEDLMDTARQAAASGGAEVWAGHYSRRGLLWSKPASPPDLQAMIASDKRLGLDGSLIWNFPLELGWMDDNQGIFHQRDPPSEAEPEADTVKLLAFWPQHEVAYPGWHHSFTSSKPAVGKVALTLSEGRDEAQALLTQPCNPSHQPKVCFVKRVTLGEELLYQDSITTADANGTCVPGVCPGLSSAAKAKGVGCTVSCSTPGTALLALDIPEAAAAPLTAELRVTGTVGNMEASVEITAPSAFGPWEFSSDTKDALLLDLYKAATSEFAGTDGPRREVILYQRTDRAVGNATALAILADFAIEHKQSFTAVSPTSYQVTAAGDLRPWSDEDEAFAAQFVPHGLRVLPLIWSDCAAHPRPLTAFRKIMEEPSRFIAEAITRAHANNFSGFVLDWEPTGELTLADSHAFPRFISTFADAMHAATPPLEYAAATFASRLRPVRSLWTHSLLLFECAGFMSTRAGSISLRRRTSAALSCRGERIGSTTHWRGRHPRTLSMSASPTTTARNRWRPRDCPVGRRGCSASSGLSRPGPRLASSTLASVRPLRFL